ncbi:uncharacterized protein [Montipora capricornis]|uniref:uncharacterized protein n=1 Tax=Montipora capricornis TaxID=246305 RepID=UPI0035F1F83A
MVKYCAVAVCKNGSQNRPDLSYFRFPSDQKLRKKWETFCRRADEKFKTRADPRICSQHFSREDLKRTLSGSGNIEVISCGVPTIFDTKQPAAKSDPRQERKNKRDRRAQHLADNSTKLPVKRQRVDAQEGKIGTVHSSAGNISVIGDHDYTDRIENVDERQRNVLCQTELTMEDLAKMERGINQSSTSIPTSSQEVKVSGNAQRRREQLVQDVLKSDESVKFYTGIPSIPSFRMQEK